MGLLKQAASLRRRLQQLWQARDPHASDRLRICRVEELEPRNLLAVDVPNINVGIHYYEADGGQDTAGDRFEITFNGGAPGTQLKQIVIDTDKAADGLSVGDAFFDTAAGGTGASLAFPFTIVDQTGITTAQGTVADGGTSLVLDFTGFDVGEKFIFSIDVDEKGFLANSSNAIVEGEEFEASKMSAWFIAPHFFDTKTSPTDPPRFFDTFTFAGTGLNLPPDAYIPAGGGAEAPVRTAGVKAVLTPVPLPITISGTVFEDVNLNNTREGGDPGISGVSLALLELEGGTYVATGKTAVTNGQGKYAFDGVLPGTYRVVETQPNGYFSVGAKAGTVNGLVNGSVTTVDVISDITLLGGQDSINNDYAEARPANLSGHVYHDADDDGIRDAGEEGIGSVKVVLERLASTNPLLASSFVEVFTDASGFWTVTGLRPGNYVVREVQPLGFFDGKDRAGTLGGTAVNPGDEINSIFVASGQTGENYDFGELRPVSISGMVHTDVDFDCLLDANETPLAGVTIFLLDAAGNRIPGKSTTTKADGTYEFTGLAPGTYGVEEVQPPGYFDGGESLGSHGGASPRNDVFTGVVIGSGQSATEYNFCEHPPATLAGRVYIDDNDNGLIDSGEVGIGGVTLQLLNAAGAATGVTTTTAADGSYSFTGLAPGVWGVAEVQPNGFYDGKDTAGNAGGSALNPGDRIAGASLAPAQSGVNYNFGELRPASISGRVIRDEDGDCVLDPEEQALSGVTVFLLDAAGNRIATTTTNSDGFYTFSNLKPGTYGVEEITPPGVFDGDDFVGSHGGSIVANDKITGAILGSGTVAVNYDFCENSPVTLAGRVYADDNDNGLIDAGEAGIGGATLRLLNAAGTFTGVTTTTAADGSYIFTGLAPGVYGVAELQPAGFYDGKDTAGTAGGVAENPGDRITGATLNPGVYGKQYNFGELRPASIRGRVHADLDGDCELDPGEQPLGGVTILLLDAAGNTLQTTQTAANGTYQFTNLKPGVYGVKELQPAGYYDGDDEVGSAGGVLANDLITQVPLGPGVNAIDYNFCEEPPASISGRVHADNDGDCELDPGETTLEGVTIFLLDAAGNRIASTKTGIDGRYTFTGLAPDTVYGVEEIQPGGYYDGEDMVGSAGGVLGNDRITQVLLKPGVNAIDYNFCEELPASISGRVHTDTDGDCELDPGESTLEGVTIFLLDATGNRIASTKTGADGRYTFTGLAPDTVYGVEEIQPGGYYDGGDMVGSAGGVLGNDRITQVLLKPGVNAVDYNFCEKPPASISGRVHTDKDGDCLLDADEVPLEGVTIFLLDAAGNRIASTKTGADGRYTFTGLAPDTIYGVEEIQPGGYYDGGDMVGSAGGVNSANDFLTQVLLTPGMSAVDYNFCEEPPATISGRVHVDNDGDCELDPDETTLAGVTIFLLDASGNRIASTKTGADGRYTFTGLAPDTVYGLEEVQPDGQYDGEDMVGSAGGVAGDDLLTQILLGPGVDATDYNFCEVPPASLSGRVYLDQNNNGKDDSEPGIAGVTLTLLDANGNPLNNTTTTDSKGNYFFGGLEPGVYGVQEKQPEAYFDGLDSAGSAGGVAQNPGDRITGATLKPLQAGKNYNFGELPGGVISGFVFRDGPPIGLAFGQTAAQVNIEQVRPGVRGANDLPIAGVKLFLGDADGKLFQDATGNFITAVTDARGFYQFTGLTPGTYTVFQQQPSGYIDGVDTPGSTGGLAANSSNLFSPALINVNHRNDAIVGIGVQAGTASVENNFSEVEFSSIPFDPPPERRPPPPPPSTPGGVVLQPYLVPFSPVPPILPVSYTAYYGGGVGNTQRFSWHLSVIDAGSPRGDKRRAGELIPVSEARFDAFQAMGAEMTESKFVLKVEGQADPRMLYFGMEGATPIAGDFDGDGRSEIGVFHRGQWYIDLNGNGIWDAEDLWAELGGPADMPVTGDWDGDGKTDIGIFGPKWTNDERAVQREPGLPDTDNEPTGKHKNVPPKPQDAAAGVRKLKKSSQGRMRADLVDHVFFYGSEKDVPLAGDWNGDGIASIGIYRDGLWILDENGDGQWLPGEPMAEFGKAGDIPIVGDFNGDGIDELAVYRGGVWYIDINNNRKLDAEDLTINYGGPNDRPIVGDWNGDGIDEVGLYQDGEALREKR